MQLFKIYKIKNLINKWVNANATQLLEKEETGHYEVFYIALILD